MEWLERDFHDASSSYDEILDFELQEESEEVYQPDTYVAVEFYRLIEEY